MRRALRVLLLFAAGLVAAPPCAGAGRAAIATAHPLATQAGHEILARGGNAFDAAVAAAAALAVVEPYSSGLGGGGFWLLHRAADGHEIVIDSRETAPLSTDRARYLDGRGRPIAGATTRGGAAVAIPGVPAALDHVSRRYGRLSLTTTLAPAIRLARAGFPVDARYARIAALREQMLQQGHGTGIFLDSDRAPQPGFMLRQAALAETLERIAGEGADGFYRGPVAAAIVEAVNATGGRWSAEDLAGYRIVERAPLVFTHGEARIVTMPPPSAGGVALAQALRILSVFELGDARSPESAHLVVEALRRAFLDRGRHLGDPDFVPVPVAQLVSVPYAYSLARGIRRDRTSPGAALQRVPAGGGEGGNTTHFSIVDAEGNRVAATLSINLLFGAGIVGGASGVLLNNQMDDFSLTPETPNAFRLRGGEANAPAPGKRPVSSMMPTFVEDARGVLVLGTPGGSRIVSQVLLAVLDHVRSRTADPAALVAPPRYHHQLWPDVVEVEPDAFDSAWRAALEAKGHRIEEAIRRWGNMQAVFVSRHTGEAVAASDPRGSDIAWY